jgi:hypothetical protein
MVNYTINYIVYTAGHRHHHAGTQTQLIPSAPGVSNPGEHFPVFAFPTLPYMGNNLPFAFMSVVGNADNNHLYTTPGNKDVQTGNTDIKITIVYAPQGGIDGHGGPGVWVDAFNVDIGDFSDSDFMSVYTNGTLDNAQSLTANNDGVVSSVKAEDMRAYATVDGVPFLEWEKVSGSTVTNPDYMLAAQENGIVFAFYQTPGNRVPYVPANLGQNEGWIYVSAGVMVDGGGLVIGPDGVPHPVDPWGPLVAQLMSTVVILSVAANMAKKEKEMVITLAATHLDSLKKSISKMEL